MYDQFEKNIPNQSLDFILFCTEMFFYTSLSRLGYKGLQSWVDVGFFRKGQNPK